VHGNAVLVYVQTAIGGSIKEGDFMGSRLDRIKQAQNESKKKFDILDLNFDILDLNDVNVQKIFNRCLAKPESKETSYSQLYIKQLGYEKEDVGLTFDKSAILSNKKTFEYLFGQLDAVHCQQVSLKVEDFFKSYNGSQWTQNKISVMQLIYLGACKDIKMLNRFIAKTNTTSIRDLYKPTISPKDPNFPAWWAEHKSEWEDSTPSD
jgi:hypothetical protein